MLPDGDTLKLRTVSGYKHDHEGNLTGSTNPNPLLNTQMYQVTFSNGSIRDFAANAIAAAIYTQHDDKGNKYLLIKEIIDHERLPEAINMGSEWVTSSNDNKSRIRTMRGWRMCVLWKDGSTTWEKLSTLKGLYPLHVIDYVHLHNLQDEPAFAWWIPMYTQYRDRIIKSVKTRTAKRNVKFGIKIPTSVEDALKIDRETNTTYWGDAIEKEMRNNRVAFQILSPNEKVPQWYKFIRCHMNFEIKMDFTRKARFVTGGHMTDPPSFLTYSSVVSRDSV